MTYSLQIGFQLLRLQVEFNPAEFGALALTFVVFLRFGHPMRRQHLDAAAIFLGEVITQFFFQFFGVGDFFHKALFLIFKLALPDNLLITCINYNHPPGELQGKSG